MNQHTPTDFPGRNRLFTNVAAGWIVNAVTLVIGFVMPRLIYDSVGVVALGVWDLCWSLLTYITASGLGTASAVTHFVARYRVGAQPGQIATTIATAFYCQLIFALLAAGGFVLLMSALPLWMPAISSGVDQSVPILGGLLAATVALALVGDVNQGILNGCHRGAVNDALVVAADITLAIAMVAAVVSGHGITALAFVTLATRCMLEAVRLLATLRICPEASASPRLWRGRRARELLSFSTKTSIGIAQELLVHQFARLALMASAGPVALACYSRYATLARQISRAVDRFTYVVPPITSGLLADGQRQRIAGFGQRASSAALMVTLPVAIVFGVFGDEIIRYWMGEAFVTPGIAWVLALMTLMQADRSVATGVLSGMNAHGRVALACLTSSTITFAVLLLWLYPLDPLRTAILVSLTMIGGVFVPHLVLSSRRIGVRPVRYIRAVYARPVLCNLVFLFGLLVAQQRLQSGAAISAGLTLAAFCLVLGFLYWHLVFDDSMRMRVRSTLRLRAG